MFDTVVISTDGSESVERAVDVALDLAAKFDAEVHALYVIDSSDVQASPEQVRTELETALEDVGEDALRDIVETADREVVTAVREGQPAAEITRYVQDFDADVVAMGTRGRHGEHSFLLGSVAEAVVRRCPAPVMTIRQLDGDETRPDVRA